eukprot:6209333-Pleurochrysis_carterae.AAC.1
MWRSRWQAARGQILNLEAPPVLLPMSLAFLTMPPESKSSVRWLDCRHMARMRPPRGTALSSTCIEISWSWFTAERQQYRSPMKCSNFARTYNAKKAKIDLLFAKLRALVWTLTTSESTARARSRNDANISDRTTTNIIHAEL